MRLTRGAAMVMLVTVMAAVLGGCQAGEKPPLRSRLNDTKRMELGWPRDERLRDLGNEATDTGAIALAAESISAIGNPHLRDRTARANAEKLEKKGDRESALIIADLILSDYVRHDTLEGMRKRASKQMEAERAKAARPT